MSQKWEYNGVTLEVDLQDLEFAEKYEAAFLRMEEDEKSVRKAGKTSEIIREYSEMYYRLFDGIYGQGTADKLFSGRKNVRMCDEAYAAFIGAAKSDVADARQRRSEFVARYAPNQNREQRRANNKKNRYNKPHLVEH